MHRKPLWFGTVAPFFFKWRDKIVFARKGQNKSELKMDVKEIVTFEFLN